MQNVQKTIINTLETNWVFAFTIFVLDKFNHVDNAYGWTTSTSDPNELLFLYLKNKYDETGCEYKTLLLKNVF